MTKKIRCTIYLPFEQKHEIEKIAKLAGVSRNVIIQTAIYFYINFLCLEGDKEE